MEAPRKIFINHWGGERYWKSPAECPVEDDIEYILSNEYTALLERHRRLVKAVKEWMARLDAMVIDDEHSCFSECVLVHECEEDTGTECLFVARLRAALEEEG